VFGDDEAAVGIGFHDGEAGFDQVQCLPIAQEVAAAGLGTALEDMPGDDAGG
jgi:hypothetical protein